MEVVARPRNRLARQLGKLNALPVALRRPVCQWLMHRTVPFVGTAKVVFEKLDGDSVRLALPNRRRVQNHIRGIHASATALLAETATGLALNLHIPDDKLPLLKSMNIRYLRRAKGGLTAESRLTDTQIEMLTREERGEVSVAVTVTDEAGEHPVDCEFVWAWIPKRRD